MIFAKFVHNQLLKRLWRYAVRQLYYRLFYTMEDVGILNINNEVHIFALHFVYVGRINEALKAFFLDGITTLQAVVVKRLYNEGMITLSDDGILALDYTEPVDSNILSY